MGAVWWLECEELQRGAAAAAAKNAAGGGVALAAGGGATLWLRRRSSTSPQYILHWLSHPAPAHNPASLMYGV